MTDTPPPPSPAQPTSEDAPPRVLVVDDDEANRDSLARRLQRRGHVVVTAADGPSALGAIEADDFDLVLLDVNMPGMSGLEVLERVRRDRPATALPIVMATARDATSDLVEAFRLGANDYVTKPLDFAVVFARVQTQLTMRRSVQRTLALEQQLRDRNALLEAANVQLRESARRTRRELLLAAKIQATFLPHDQAPRVGDVQFAWRYDPCDQLAGDALNVCPLDADHVGFYVLDVSGHGVAASLTAVTAARLLAPPHEPDSLLIDRSAADATPRAPSHVLAQLEERFAFNAETGQFLTSFYAVLNTRTRRLTYASAGHPGATRVTAGGVATVLTATRAPIGIGLVESHEQHDIDLAAGDRLYLFSDGVIESRHPDRGMLGFENLTPLLTELRSVPLSESISALHRRLDEWRGGRPSTDDVSVLALEVPK